MKFTCPHCHKEFETNVGSLIAKIRTPKRAEASRLNGSLGGRKMVENPVRLRPWHPNHPKHLEWLRLQELKKIGPA